jgi:hypothetical protein
MLPGQPDEIRLVRFHWFDLTALAVLPPCRGYDKEIAKAQTFDLPLDLLPADPGHSQYRALARLKALQQFGFT